jgi:sensor histidine kinase YesM
MNVNDLPLVSTLLSADDLVNKWGVPCVGVLFIIVDGFLWLANRQQNDRSVAHWITRLSVPMLALVVVSLFALFIVVSNNFVTDKASEYRGLAYLGFYVLLWIEVLLIYLSYYLIYYLHHHFLYRRLLQEKGFFHYLMGAVAILLLLSPVYAQLISWMPLVKSLKLHTVGLLPSVFADINFIIPIGIFILSLPFIMLQEWYQRQHTISELEKEKTMTELDLLKQQINPHFFFNTLNNLYAMSLTQDEETPDTILKLSELMRYVIYQGQQAEVPLQSEIKYLQDYLDLQQIRLHQQADISFYIHNEQADLMVAPLLFIILLENAFKHGIEPAEEASFLAIELTVSDRQLIFKCRNSKAASATADKTSGIGLQNLRRRLELLYPDRHELQLQTREKEYVATLKLKL